MDSRRPEPDSLKDLGNILDGWVYEPGTINVRRITGLDGMPKLQMRLELGLLQMEITGRPDGVRPHGFESLLEYFDHRLTEHRQKEGAAEGFVLSPKECSELRDEAAMYYQRYLSLFVLGDFQAVVRDTSRNIRVLDLCGRFAVKEQDRIFLEQYRPYIIMMRTRAAASILFKDQRLQEALTTVREGIAQIKAFFDKFDQAEAFADCEEAKVLKRFAREIKRKMPVGASERLERRLKKAIAAEQYELAAKLRDEIAELQATQLAGHQTGQQAGQGTAPPSVD